MPRPARPMRTARKDTQPPGESEFLVLAAGHDFFQDSQYYRGPGLPLDRELMREHWRDHKDEIREWNARFHHSLPIWAHREFGG